MPDPPVVSYVTWSCDEVVSWLSEQVKLGQYSPVFRDNAIDGAELGCLTSEVLQKDLGIGEEFNFISSIRSRSKLRHVRHS